MSKTSKRRISRRDLIANAGLAAGAATLPGASLAANPMDRWDYEVDVVCVGGGCAGVTAAVVAADNGNGVILLESAPILGGTTRKSGGVAWVPNHPLLSELGVEDSKEDCMRYMARFSYPHRYAPDSPMLGLDPLSYRQIEALYDHGGAMVGRLASIGAVQFGVFKVGGDPSPDYADHLPENKLPAGRAIVPKDANGTILPGRIGDGGWLVDSCETALLKKDGKVLTDHHVTSIVLNDGRVVGVVARTGEKTVRIGARKGVIFATGGFAHNTDLIQLHHRMLDGSCAVPQSQGDFLSIASAAGAKPGQLDLAWGTQVVYEQALQNRVMAVCVFFAPGDAMLMVNKHGQRAVNEKRNYNDRTRVHYVYDPVAEDYPNRLLFMIFDERGRDAFGGAYPIPYALNTPYLISGKDFDELSDNLETRLQSVSKHSGGVALAADFKKNLADTVKRFNGYARSGNDPEFSRGKQAYDREWQKYFSAMRKGSTEKPSDMPNPTMHPFRENGPYYAVILGPGALDTCGGPLTNEKAQVLGSDGQPIPGLYGAGNCIQAPSRDAYYGAGGTIGPGMTWGYIAAQHVSGKISQ